MILNQTEVLQDLEYKTDETQATDTGEAESSGNYGRPNQKENQRLVNEEEKETGVVKVHVYQAYWRAVGSILGTIVLVSLFLMQGELFNLEKIRG